MSNVIFLKMSKFLCALLLGLISIFLISCESEKTVKSDAGEKNNTIKVGTISGPETELMEKAKKVANEKYHLNIIIVPFNDYSMPNVALNEGSIDANMFQTLHYYRADIKAHQYKFAIIGKTFIFPMAIYSKKIKAIADVPAGAIVSVPNDPSNETRALLLLQEAGLIKLKPNTTGFATNVDILENPKQIQIKPLDAAQLPRSLDDVTLAVINTNYAMPAGLLPSRDSLFKEKPDSPYANIVVARSDDKKNPTLKLLIKSLHSSEVTKKAEELFQDQAIPAWNLKINNQNNKD